MIWQLSANFVGQAILLPSPLRVAARLCTIWQEPGFFWALTSSFSRIIGGFLGALLLGSSLAVLAGRFPLCKLLLAPFTATIKTVPVASFIVICLIWLSSAQLSIFVSFLMVLPVIYTNVLHGIESAPLPLLEVCYVFDLPAKRRLLYFWLPQLRPFLLSACGIGIGLAFKAGIAAEIIGIPPDSIGRMFYDAKIYLNSSDLFAWTVLVVAGSLVFEQLFLLLLRLLFRRLEAL